MGSEADCATAAGPDLVHQADLQLAGDTRALVVSVYAQTLQPPFPRPHTAQLGESHDLLHEFPNLVTKIAELRSNDEDFAQLMNEYDNLDARVRKLEELGTPVADETMEDLKKERLLLKDRLYEILRS